MKKIFALALAIVMMMAIALPVFAATTDVTHAHGTLDGNDADAGYTYSDAMELTYGVSQTYTVIIPADITFDSTLKATREVAVENVVIAGNEKIKINVISANNWTMVDYEDNNVTGTTVSGNSDPVNYWYGVDAAVAQGTYTLDHEFEGTGPIIDLEAKAGNNGLEGNADSVVLHFGTRGTAQEGTFKDFLTFVVEVYEIQNNG